MQPPSSASPAALLAWLDAHYRAMPPVAALQPGPASFDGSTLSLAAPLAANHNDKGCAFGGSLVSLMTLAGWGLVTLRLAQAGLHADVFVADSQVHYLAPLFGDLDARARLADETGWDGFAARFRERGRARIALRCEVALPSDGEACMMTAAYAAIARP